MSSSFISQGPVASECVYGVTQNDAIQTITTACRQEDLTKTNAPPAASTNVAPAASTGQSTTSPIITTSLGVAIQSTPSASIAIVSAPGNSTSNGSATPTTTPNTGGKGLAGGAVAGIAIGMLLAGVVIAGLLFSILLRRQKKKQVALVAVSSRRDAPHRERNMVPEKGATVTTGGVRSIDDLLPQPVEDDAITGALSKIRDSIKNHVRTYYHSEPVAATDLNEAGLPDVSNLMGTDEALLLRALLNPSSRDNALRSVVGAVILSRCTGERSPNLLPSELAGLSSVISVNDHNSAQMALFSKWKAITGALLQQQYETYNQSPARTQSVQDATTSLDSVLAPFVKGSIDGDQRRKNLDMILTRAAKFAFLLFAQPGSFRFDYAGRLGGLTIFPALVQTVGDQGQALSPVKMLTEIEVVAA